MERSVRYIFRDGFKPALCFRGRKSAHCIINDETGVRVIELPVRQVDTSQIIPRHGAEYPPGLFAERILEIGKRKGITRRALALLDVPDSAEDADNLPPDDPTASAVSGADGSLPEAPCGATEGNGSSGAQPRAKPRPLAASAATERAPSDPRKSSRTAPRRGDPPSAVARTASPVSKSAGKSAATQQKGRGELIAKLAAELSIAPQQLRVKLRSAGLRAPYDNESALRKLIRSWR